MHCLVKAWGRLGWRSPTDSLLQIRMRRSIVELYGFDPTKVIVVSGMLRVARRGGKCGLGHKLVGLVVKAVLEVTPQYTINERRLRLIVVAECCSSLGG